MFKFIHAADIHLDSPQRGLSNYEGAPVGEIRGATRKALENLVSLAVEEKVAFVLIVGDLYDGEWEDFNTGLFFGIQMARLRDEGIPLILLRGNHDAASKMTKDLRLLENTKLLSMERPETYIPDDLGVAFHGQSFAKRAEMTNLAKGYPEGVAGLFNIGLLHTCVEGREGHENYAPCSLDDLRFKGYGYWALGHIHKRETLIDADPVVAFPGNIQGRSVRETGPKGCLLVTVEGGEVSKVEPRWLDVARWDICRVDAMGAEDGDELLQRFRDRLSLMIPEAEDRLLAVRVEVSGACRAHAELSSDWNYWVNEVRQTATEGSGGRVWVEKVIAKTRMTARLEDDQGDGPMGELNALLEELREDAGLLKALCDVELEDLRKKLDPKLLDELDAPERLRELLDQVGPLLRTRLGAHGGEG